jgi:methylglyoxal synthase
MKPRQFGLVASRRHRTASDDGGLFRWASSCADSIRSLGLKLHAVGGTAAALEAGSALAGYDGLVCYGDGREGGLMRLVSHVAGSAADGSVLDGVIYLVDPVDPTTLYPEALALKRQCVIHGKPFISTVAGAIEWIAVEAVLAGVRSPDAAATLDLTGKSIALIAHDALKQRMVDFAAEHFELLSQCSSRVATGTTGGLLNQVAWSKGWPSDKPWVHRFLSGPMGGDAQIAELVLDRRCAKVLFFEDPHVARQHEADIQLLERAVCAVSREATCASSPTMAKRWAQAASMARQSGRSIG